MRKKIEYTDAPVEVDELLENGIIVPNFELSPEGVREFTERKKKKTISIFLTSQTIDKFKQAADKIGSRYQTMISDVLDTYSQRYL